MSEAPQNSKHPAVGIDLGTTYSAIAYIDPTGRPTTLPNGLGELLTPTAVLVDDKEIVVGSEAARASTMEPDAFAECFKRDIGSPVYRRDVRGVNLPPEVLSGFILERLKKDAEARIGPFTDVVITVPAFFDETRRKATQDAGRLAGLNVIDIINEPTAAAVCYGYQQGFLNIDDVTSSGATDPIRVLVYDLGGGTFDVTLLEIKGSEFKAIATDGDVRLGGKDFDERLVDYLAEQFVSEHGVDPRSDPQDAAQLWLDAQTMKHTLSQRTSASAVVFHAGVRTRVNVDRKTFEDLCCDLLERTETTTTLVLKDSGLRWEDVDRVLLVGGSSRLPMVAAMLERLTGKSVDRSASPDEAVAHGAALYAAMTMHGQSDGHGITCSLVNVNSHSLGVAALHKSGTRINAIMIPKNTPLPARKVMRFVTSETNQAGVCVPILEGESDRPSQCIHLGNCMIRDLPTGLPKGATVEVTYNYLSNGRISVAARVPDSRVSANVDIKRDNARDLETLDAWRAPGCSYNKTPPIAPTMETNLRLLDDLWLKIGKAAIECDLPPDLEMCQGTARKMLDASQAARQDLIEAEQAKDRADGSAERMRVSTQIAHATVRLEQAESQANFACLVLGRECTSADVTIPNVEREMKRAAMLNEKLRRS